MSYTIFPSDTVTDSQGAESFILSKQAEIDSAGGSVSRYGVVQLDRPASDPGFRTTCEDLDQSLFVGRPMIDRDLFNVVRQIDSLGAEAIGLQVIAARNSDRKESEWTSFEAALDFVRSGDAA